MSLERRRIQRPQDSQSLFTHLTTFHAWERKDLWAILDDFHESMHPGCHERF